MNIITMFCKHVLIKTSDKPIRLMFLMGTQVCSSYSGTQDPPPAPRHSLQDSPYPADSWKKNWVRHTHFLTASARKWHIPTHVPLAGTIMGLGWMPGDGCAATPAEGRPPWKVQKWKGSADLQFTSDCLLSPFACLVRTSLFQKQQCTPALSEHKNPGLSDHLSQIKTDAKNSTNPSIKIFLSPHSLEIEYKSGHKWTFRDQLKHWIQQSAVEHTCSSSSWEANARLYLTEINKTITTKKFQLFICWQMPNTKTLKFIQCFHIHQVLR